MSATTKTDDVLNRYVEAAIANAAALDDCKAKVANQHFNRIAQLFERLKQCNERESLLPLMDHDHPAVRAWAAFHCLTVNPERAAATLAEVAFQKGAIGSTAEITLREWKAGTLKAP